MKPNRIVCWFSGGAASAVATRLAITDNARTQNLPLVVVRICRTKASADEMRFISECEKWFSVPVLQLHQRKPSWITRVFDFLALRRIPALYRRRLRDVRRAFETPGDLQIFGYMANERDRVDRFMRADGHTRISAVLLEKGYLLSDCLETLFWSGIDIPNTCRIGLSEGQKGPVDLRSSPGCIPKQLSAKVSADFSG
jgi:hypothetical protein